ncbi:ribosomal protein L32 [Lichtheimia ornata]|uniref:Large ribosomal subunit protein bL32m n=1 Tax=Lichtheimia ornata TaxID=688661 RepID=A0AAD7UWX5_9FUNG|nr:ribosomal protein L32 [Lichtheimia ornata]KAJ8655173.1 ribosomal protein L32 [Lichtheimia ornata]
MALARFAHQLALPSLTQSPAFGAIAVSSTFKLPIWLEPFLWAAPKKKTSHSKKRMRASNKGLQNKENVTACPACGNYKLLHHLCSHCYGNIKQQQKKMVA